MKFGIGVPGATGFIGMPYRQEIRESPDEAVIVALCPRRRDLPEAAGREDQARLVTTEWRQVVEHPDVDRIKSTISIARPGAEVELLETNPDGGFGNRLEKHVFPAHRGQIAGQPTTDPNLEDGYREQLFTEAAAVSAKLGTWQTLVALEAKCC